MAILRTAVVWTDDLGRTHTLKDVKSFNIKQSAGIKNNQSNITLRNSIGSIKPYSEFNTALFEPNQDILLYARYDNDGTGLDLVNDNLVFSGRVVEFEGESNDSTTDLKLKCSDSSYIMLNRIFIGEVEGTVDDIIKYVIDTSNEYTADPNARVRYDGGFIVDERSNGTSFSSELYSSPGKPVYEVLSDLSEPLYTGEPENINYRFFVDKNNQLHWFYPSDGAQHILIEGSRTTNERTYTHPITGESVEFSDTNTHKVINTKLTRAVYDIVNFIIYKAGEDLEGDQIMGFAFDPTSGIPNTNDSFRSYEKVTKTLKRIEQVQGNLNKVYGDQYELDGTSGTTSWGVSYSNAAEYNTAFVERAERVAQVLAESEFRTTGSPRFKGTIEVQGQGIYQPNDALLFSSDRLGIQNSFMRITDVQHNFQKGGWFTTLSVQEEIRRNL